jgi:hypothetical protein
MWGLSYPLNIPLLNGFFQLVGDVGPISKLIPSLFYLSLLFSCYRFWRKLQIGSGLRIAGLLFIAVHPLIFLHATIGLANLPFTTYLVSAVLLLIVGLKWNDAGSQLLGGILLWLATWTRAEGAAYAMLILALLFVVAIANRRRRQTRRVLILAGMIVVMMVPWLLFGVSAVESSRFGTAAAGVLPSLMEGEFNLYELRLIPVLYLSRSRYFDNNGLVLPLFAVLYSIGLYSVFKPGSAFNRELLLYTIGLSIVPVALFYVWSFRSDVDFIPLLRRSFDRAFLPALVMIMLSGVNLFQATVSNWKTNS